MRISSAFAQLENICNLAKHHKANCNTPDCGTSLTILKRTADKLLWEVWNSEFIVAQQMVKQVEWN